MDEMKWIKVENENPPLRTPVLLFFGKTWDFGRLDFISTETKTFDVFGVFGTHREIGKETVLGWTCGNEIINSIDPNKPRVVSHWMLITNP